MNVGAAKHDVDGIVPGESVTGTARRATSNLRHTMLYALEKETGSKQKDE
jgi:hypothetical protein